ncbi:hypothetical protein QAD02_011388 [Eretmocerus hayati]|uniref:Uncharacterized protein n=1 Tax=Eretmocerus hayati TaxID=131215 RepID=A0ACC2NWW3_9HYME|nr:hypothetical protein QAD02_011388 [Eretmocerus hayati]
MVIFRTTNESDPQIILQDLNDVEKEMNDVMMKVKSIRMKLIQTDITDSNNINPVPSTSATGDNNRPGNFPRTSGIAQQKCSDICCKVKNLKTSAGLRVFCGENVSAIDWVNHVDRVSRMEKWDTRYTYLLACKAMRGKARKVALRLMEKEILNVPLVCGEPDDYPDTSAETTTYWRRKLTDEQVINRSIVTLEHGYAGSNGWLAGKDEWATLRNILLKKEELNSQWKHHRFIGFEALVKLEK